MRFLRSRNSYGSIITNQYEGLMIKNSLFVFEQRCTIHHDHIFAHVHYHEFTKQKLQHIKSHLLICLVMPYAACLPRHLLASTDPYNPIFTLPFSTPKYNIICLYLYVTTVTPQQCTSINSHHT